MLVCCSVVSGLYELTMANLQLACKHSAIRHLKPAPLYPGCRVTSIAHLFSAKDQPETSPKTLLWSCLYFKMRYPYHSICKARYFSKALYTSCYSEVSFKLPNPLSIQTDDVTLVIF